MKITPSRPDETVNYGKESDLAEFFYLVVGLGIGALAIYIASGFLVAWVASYIPQKTEQQWFGSFASGFIERTAKVNKPWLQPILDRAVHHAPKVDLQLKAGVSDDEDPNAFALPGGAIVVTSGLLKSVGSENELTMVIGHEIGHFVLRHHFQRFGRALILAVLGGFIGFEPDATTALSLPLTLFDLQFSRREEEAADEIGLMILQGTYGHVGGATEFFERLAKDEIQFPGLRYGLTHPPSVERVERLKALIRERELQVRELTPLPAD